MDPSLVVIATVAGAGPITSALTEVIIRTAGLSGTTRDRFAPILAIVVGIIVVLIANVGLGVVGHQEVVQGLFTGVIAGFTAMGVHDVATGTVAPTTPSP